MIPSVRKVIVIISILVGCLLISYSCLNAGYGGFGLANRLYVDFIDLSIFHPKDKKTGIELVSVGNGQASISMRGKIRCLKKDELCVIRGLGSVRLLYVSQESKEIVMERLHCRTQIRFRDHFFGDDARPSYEDEMKKQGWACLTLTSDHRVNPDFGIELLSIETNGATIRFPSGDTSYAESGGFFSFKQSIKGANRIQLVHIGEDSKEVLLRMIRGGAGSGRSRKEQGQTIK